MEWNKFSKIKPKEDNCILVWSDSDEAYYVGRYRYAVDSEPYLEVPYRKDGCTCQYHTWEYDIDIGEDSWDCWVLLPHAIKK